jgi:hypothetical protein
MVQKINLIPVCILAIVLGSCDSSIEVAENEVAVVTSNIHDFNGRVLKKGFHKVQPNSKIVFFSLETDTINFDVEFLFKDVRFGNIKFFLRYNPKADSMAVFYEKYQSELINPVVEVEIRTLVRDMLAKYGSRDLSKSQIETELVTLINNDGNILNNYVSIVEISSFGIEYGN